MNKRKDKLFLFLLSSGGIFLVDRYQVLSYASLVEIRKRRQLRDVWG